VGFKVSHPVDTHPVDVGVLRLHGVGHEGSTTVADQEGSLGTDLGEVLQPSWDRVLIPLLYLPAQVHLPVESPSWGIEEETLDDLLE
jgi:hypothetical protein